MGLHRSLMALVLVAAPALSYSVALGQAASLPTEVVMTNSTLTGAQQNQINQFVTRGVEQLLSGDPAAVSQGRRQLVDVFSLPGISDAFLATYSPAISRELNARAAMEHESDLVRTNAMIVASRLSDGGVVALIRQGLADANAGVRYWAAVTAAQAGSKLSPADQQSVLNLLAGVWETESSIDVLEKILLAMDAQRTPAANTMLLQALNQRVNIHAGNPTLSMKAEVESLQSVTVRTFTALTAPNANVDPKLVRQLVVVLFRYFDLSTTLLANTATPPANEEDLRRISRIAGNFLPRLAAQLEVRLNGRPANQTSLQADKLLREEWRHALTTGSSGINASELVIQPATPAKPATTQP